MNIFGISDVHLDDICQALPMLQILQMLFVLKYIVRLGIKLGSRPFFSCMKTLRGEAHGACQDELGGISKVQPSHRD